MPEKVKLRHLSKSLREGQRSLKTGHLNSRRRPDFAGTNKGEKLPADNKDLNGVSATKRKAASLREVHSAGLAFRFLCLRLRG